MPHEPWRYLPTGQRYLDPDKIPGETDTPGRGGGWRNEPWLVAQAYQRHLLQTALVDRLLGVVLDRLRAARLYDRALVVVAADHGHGFVPGFSKRLAVPENAGHIAPIPFLLKLPLQERGAVSDLPVQVTDVVPTIADVLNLSNVGGDFEGTSALDGSIPLNRARSVSSVPLDPAGAEKYEVVGMKYGLFGTTDEGLDLFALGPNGTRELIGMPASSFAVTPVAEPAVRLYQGEKLVAADRDGDAFPALLQGNLIGEFEDDQTVVVTIDGVVAAVTQSFQQGDATRFICMLSPRFFTAPPNEISVHLLLDDRRSLLSLPSS